MQNKDRYFSLIRKIYLLQNQFNFKIIKTGEVFFHVTYPIFKIEFGEGNKKILIFAGIHGDEPAGPKTVLKLISRMCKNKKFLENFSFTIFPCDNPSGYAKNKRKNSDGLDLNREFKNPNPPDEINFIRRGLGKKYFDMALGLHEDKDSNGFYLYEPPTEIVSFGNNIIRIIKKAGFPIENNYSDADSSIGDGKVIKIKRGIVVFPKKEDFERSIDKMKYWPAAIYLIKNHTKKEFTFETPSKIDLNERIKMHLMAIETSLNFLRGSKS